MTFCNSCLIIGASDNIPQVKSQVLMPFRFEKIGKKVFLTNDAGDYLWLEAQVFGDYIGGTLDKNHSDYKRLRQHNMIRDPGTESSTM